MLRSLRAQGHLTHKSTWTDVHRWHLHDTSQLRAATEAALFLIEEFGETVISTPIDLFADVLDEAQSAYEAEKATVSNHLRQHPQDSFPHVKARFSSIPENNLRDIFSDLGIISDKKDVILEHQNLKQHLRSNENNHVKDLEVPVVKKRYEETELRRLVDAYKHYLASLGPSITEVYLGEYAKARPLLATQCKEFRDLEDEDRRKYYFEKAIRKHSTLNEPSTTTDNPPL